MKTLRDPDEKHRNEGTEKIYFEDLTERMALKLQSVLRIGAGTNWELFQRAVVTREQRRETGIAAIIYRMDLEVTDAPLRIGAPAEVSARIDLVRAGEGEETRIIARSLIEIFGSALDGGERVPAGRSEIHHVFTRLSAPPDRRRVRALDPRLGFSKELPAAVTSFLRPEELLRAPEGFREASGDLGDGEPHVWPYANTDPNQHVHAMDYVSFAQVFATDQLARAGHSAKKYLFNKARVLYRRPFFTGDNYHRRGRIYESAGGSGASRRAFIGAYYRTEGTPAPDEPPAVVFQLFSAGKPETGLPHALG